MIIIDVVLLHLNALCGTVPRGFRKPFRSASKAGLQTVYQLVPETITCFNLLPEALCYHKMQTPRVALAAGTDR